MLNLGVRRKKEGNRKEVGGREKKEGKFDRLKERGVSFVEIF